MDGLQPKFQESCGAQAALCHSSREETNRLAKVQYLHCLLCKYLETTGKSAVWLLLTLLGGHVHILFVVLPTFGLGRG